MFSFWKSGPRKDEKPRPAPAPVVGPVRSPAARRSRVIDVPGLFRQAGQRIGLKQLLRMGKKDITLLSRERIDELINRSVKAAVAKHVSGAPLSNAAMVRIQEDSRAQFAELLRKAKFTANISDDPTRDLLRLIQSFTTHVPAAKGPVVEVQGSERRVVPFTEYELEPGRGLDIGTVNICAGARKRNSGETVYNVQRSAFLDLRDDPLTQSMLTKFGIDYIAHEGKTHILGDTAFDLANLFEKPVRRALRDGTISREEPEALFVVNCLVTQLLGRPQKAGEVCVYSVPAEAADGERTFIYHRAALEIMIRNLGFTPKPMLESHLIVFAELKDQAYTGIGISCGGGMFNVCVSYKGVPALTFSTSRGGDWIDESVADSLGLSVPLVTAVKEGGMDLRKPKGRVEEAIAIYYRHLIQYTLEQMRERMGSSGTLPNFKEPIQIVCSGGTALIPGFIDMFEDEFKRAALPVPVAGIRNARDPLKAVTAGCVQAALEEMRAPAQAGVQVAEAALQRSDAREVQKADEEARRKLEARRPVPKGREAPAVVQKMDEGLRRKLEAVGRGPVPVEREAAVIQKADEDLRRKLEEVGRGPATLEREAAVVQQADEALRKKLQEVSRGPAPLEREAAIVQEADESVRRKLEEVARGPAPMGREAAIVQKADEGVRRKLEEVARGPAPMERDEAIVQKADDALRKKLEEAGRGPGSLEREAPVIVPADDAARKKLESAAGPAPTLDHSGPVPSEEVAPSRNGKPSPGPAV